MLLPIRRPGSTRFAYKGFTYGIDICLWLSKVSTTYRRTQLKTTLAKSPTTSKLTLGFSTQETFLHPFLNHKTEAFMASILALTTFASSMVLPSLTYGYAMR